MPNTATDAVKKLAGLIKDIKFAMLTTVHSDGSLHSRPMATQQQEFNGDLWFFTRGDSVKVEDAERDEHVNVSYSSPDDQKYVSISGMAVLVRDRQKIEELWNPIYKAWFPKGLEDPELALLKVNVEGAEYWDTPSGKMVQLIGFVKAIATGEPYKASKDEHDKLDLNDNRDRVA
jgi:general stress protein 26